MYNEIMIAHLEAVKEMLLMNAEYFWSVARDRTQPALTRKTARRISNKYDMQVKKVNDRIAQTKAYKKFRLVRFCPNCFGRKSVRVISRGKTIKKHGAIIEKSVICNDCNCIWNEKIDTSKEEGLVLEDIKIIPF